MFSGSVYYVAGNVDVANMSNYATMVIDNNVNDEFDT